MAIAAEPKTRDTLVKTEHDSADLAKACFSDSAAGSSALGPELRARRLAVFLRPVTLIGLACMCLLAFLARLMSVVRYEVVIHEFDPYFQYRATQYLVEHGSDAFQSWFDERTWYPLSRSMPISMYPGLQYTAKFFIDVCKYIIRIPITVLQSTVFMGPVMSVFGTLFSYDMGRQLDRSSTSTMTGLLCGFFFSLIPGFIQRSVAGSYDNESNSITAMVIGFDLWLRACNARYGDMLTPLLSALAYFYMTVSWGGYVFLTALIPLHVFLCIVFRRDTPQLRLSFKIWQLVGHLYVGLVWREQQGVFTQVIYLPGIGVLALVLYLDLLASLKRHLSPKSYTAAKVRVTALAIALVLVMIPILVKMGLIGKLAGRLLSFFNPTYAKKHNPIVASVAEHQPTVWTSFMFNTWFLIILVPAGIYYALVENLSVPAIFLCVYIASTCWFTAVMSRMILMASPAICLCAAYVVSNVCKSVVEFRVKMGADGLKKLAALVASLALILLLILSFMQHALLCATEMYSSPSVVMIGGKRNDGSDRPIYIDDFREAYSWLEHSTDENAHVAFWWDYGYQTGEIGNKTTLVDNLTRSDFWIGLIGALLSSDENTAWRIAKELNIDYVLVVSGGLSGYSGDDIGKFLWPIRISGNRHFEQTYPWIRPIRERDFYNVYGNYRVDADASTRMKQSTMFKFNYYKNEELDGRNFDRNRNQLVDAKAAGQLDAFEEAFSSERHIVRIYKVKDSLNF